MFWTAGMLVVHVVAGCAEVLHVAGCAGQQRVRRPAQVAHLAAATWTHTDGSTHRRRIRQKRRQRSSLLIGGLNCFHSMSHERFSTRMIWRKGWQEERTLDHPVHTTPKWISFQNFPSNKHNCYSKWLVRHSSTVQCVPRTAAMVFSSVWFFFYGSA